MRVLVIAFEDNADWMIEESTLVCSSRRSGASLARPKDDRVGVARRKSWKGLSAEPSRLALQYELKALRTDFAPRDDTVYLTP
jgi:hypothetical protein